MRQSSVILLLVLSIPVLALLNLAVGSVGIPLSEVMGILSGRGTEVEVWNHIVLQTRLPQTLTAMACGAGLSVAGLEMQTVFHNPLAGPSVLGISSAASDGTRSGMPDTSSSSADNAEPLTAADPSSVQTFAPALRRIPITFLSPCAVERSRPVTDTGPPSAPRQSGKAAPDQSPPAAVHPGLQYR